MRNKPETHRWCMSSWLYSVPAESVDAERGVIAGAAIVTAGEAKGHGVSLDEEFVNDTVRLGNARAQGVKVRFGHPSMSSTALGTFLGRAKHFRADGDVARADIYLSEEARRSPQGNLYEYVLGMAANEPDAFGASIVFLPGRIYKRNETGRKVYEPDVDASSDDYRRQRKEWDEAPPPVFTEISELLGADLVDDPAANAEGLFSAWDSGTLAQQVSEFLDTHPEVFRALDRDPVIVERFLARYEEYRSRRDGGGTPGAGNQGDENMAQEIVQPAAEAEPAGAPEALETNDVATEASDASPVIELADLAQMAEEFGAELAVQVAVSGGGYADAREQHYARLVAENAALREQLAARPGQEAHAPADTPVDGADPATFSEAPADNPKPIDLRVEVRRWQSEGLSAADAWRRAAKEHPEEYAKLRG